MCENNILETRGIRISFSGTEVLHDVDFALRAGEVHALVGENGAGKSTFLKILSGIYRADHGEIRINGKPVEIHTPKDAYLNGFSVIHQELAMEKEMSVHENIVMGNEPRCFGIYRKKKAISIAKSCLEQVHAGYIDPTRKAGELPIALQQMVEISRAVARKTKIIAMDEPTSSLTDKEIDGLFQLITDLKKTGHAIIYISHRMEEIFQIADRVSVLRDGSLIQTLNIEDCTKDKIINLMAGEEVQKNDLGREDREIPDDPILEVKNLKAYGKISNINFRLRRGEVLGFGGLVGSGRSEILQAIMGLAGDASGEIFLDGKEMRLNDIKQMIRNGVGLVPEDRKLQGLCLNMNTRSNLSLAILNMLSKAGVVSSGKENTHAKESIERIDIRPTDPEYATVSLSGGNQQKIVLGKWLSLPNLKVLLLDEPTRGIDVRTKYYIHRFIRELSMVKGLSIIVVSSELPELLELSDRILVMKNGSISRELMRSEATKEKILQGAF